MSVSKIIKEAMDKNPLGVSAAVQEELRDRLALALEAKMKKEDDHEEMDDQDHEDDDQEDEEMDDDDQDEDDDDDQDDDD